MRLRKEVLRLRRQVKEPLPTASVPVDMYLLVLHARQALAAGELERVDSTLDLALRQAERA